MDVHGFDGDDNLLHVIVYGRITGAEVAVHTIALDGHLDEEASPDSAAPSNVTTKTSSAGVDSGADRAPRSGRAGSGIPLGRAH